MTNGTVSIQLGENTVEPVIVKAVPGEVIDVHVDSEIKDEAQAKQFLQGMTDFIRSGSMEEKAKEISKRTKLPSKEISKKFLLRVLGIIGSTAEIAVNTAGDLISTVINLIGKILLEGVDLIIRLAQRLVRVVTLNQGITA